MVHLLEQSIASVEQVVSGEFVLSMQQSGLLSTSFRISYGLGAVLAGMLADRLGSQRVLGIYLAGASVVCLAMAATPWRGLLFPQLFLLGCFASMYHPAGLALLSKTLAPGDRVRALGMHGVFGSTGISSAPFLAGIALAIPWLGWRGYYCLLAVGCAILAYLVFSRLHPGTQGHQATMSGRAPLTELHRFPFFALVLSSGTSGIVYGGYLHFLTRYLSEVDQIAELFGSGGEGRATSASYFAAMVLMSGAVGQWIAGRLAKPRHLAILLAAVYAGNAPFLWWMSFAEGWDRLISTCLMAFIHFMNQPLYNSLLPEYIPAARRSTWFGFSNMMGFGLGAIGPFILGSFEDYRAAYAFLACLSLLAAVFPLVVWASTHFRTTTHSTP